MIIICFRLPRALHLVLRLAYMPGGISTTKSLSTTWTSSSLQSFFVKTLFSLYCSTNEGSAVAWHKQFQMEHSASKIAILFLFDLCVFRRWSVRIWWEHAFPFICTLSGGEMPAHKTMATLPFLAMRKSCATIDLRSNLFIIANDAWWKITLLRWKSTFVCHTTGVGKYVCFTDFGVYFRNFVLFFLGNIYCLTAILKWKHILVTYIRNKIRPQRHPPLHVLNICI